MSWIQNASQRWMPFGIPLKSEFPPAHLLDSRPLRELTVDELEKRTQRLRKLENLYHKGQAMAWDGKKLLAELVEKHGPVRLPLEKREALANIFTIILWGELGAWEVASFLAEHIRDNTEAKMAATMQTFDEARHYYVLRDYLKLLDLHALPEPNSFIRSMLAQLLATDSVLYKLVGMQLFVEHIAVHLFRSIAELKIEPILSDLMVYFHRDEARHVGLGKLYLPEILPKLTRREALSLQLYQLWLVSFMQLSMDFHRQDAETIGIDIQDSMFRALKDQTVMLEEIKQHDGVRGVVLTPKRLRFVNKFLIRSLWTKGDVRRPVLSSGLAMRARDGVVRATERMWGVVA